MLSNLIHTVNKAKYKKLADIVIEKTKDLNLLSDEDIKDAFLNTDEYLKKFAVLYVISERTLGLTPYHVQIMASLAMYDGYVLNMHTGEGKTLVGAMVAAMHASDGKEVTVATANEYLARRDSLSMKPLFESAGILSGYIEDRGETLQVRYSNLLSSCLMWLEDFIRVDMKNISHSSSVGSSGTVLIIDEIDYSLIELSSTPVAIVERVSSEVDVYNIFEAVKNAKSNATFFVFSESGEPRYSDEFYAYVEDYLVNILKMSTLDALYSNNYSIYISFVKCYTAVYGMKKDRDYVVSDDCVKRFDQRTGRTTRAGFEPALLEFLHQKELLPPPQKTSEIISCSLQHYVKSFEQIVGLSGTAMCNKLELNKTYGLKVFSVPPRIPSKLINRGYSLYKTDEEKVAACISYIQKKINSSQPVLVVCEDDMSAISYFNLVSEFTENVSLLISSNSEDDERSLINSAGENSRVTITTRMCARGTDIVVEHDEGLCLCVTAVGVTDVDDLQLNGRTARAGRRGEVSFFVSMQDSIFKGLKKDSIPYRNFLSLSQESIEFQNKELSSITTKPIRAFQSNRMKMYRENRSRVAVYEKPIEDQLIILKKKRLEIWNISAEQEYLTKMISKNITNELLSNHLHDVLLRYTEYHGDFNEKLKKMLGSQLTALWSVHNSKLKAYQRECTGIGAADVNKFKNNCKQAFEEFALNLNTNLLMSVMATMETELALISSTSGSFLDSRTTSQMADA
ncbi:preprotein translocase subunit SecA [Photobacterium kishitanii]|uniref:Uncharacterized protein n=1 Tax=Photobacterium kishitanii TaxID=318456 RepID=A0A2T3KMZ4_9GAMM|nr:preprotein translocase subunit SecA [Photobacterium kishitanii]PSV01144.1 hypothetical protein C9J27_03735 [Photobacterium kishitanii]